MLIDSAGKSSVASAVMALLSQEVKSISASSCWIYEARFSLPIAANGNVCRYSYLLSLIAISRESALLSGYDNNGDKVDEQCGIVPRHTTKLSSPSENNRRVLIQASAVTSVPESVVWNSVAGYPSYYVRVISAKCNRLL